MKPFLKTKALPVIAGLITAFIIMMLFEFGNSFFYPLPENLNTMDPTRWGPHYWFMIHTVAFHYPKHPTAIQKKIHYRLIHNFHEFLPSKSIANVFVKMLEKYPNNQPLLNIKYALCNTSITESIIKFER